MPEVELPTDVVYAIVNDGLNAVIWGLMVERGLVTQADVGRLEETPLRDELDRAIRQVCDRWKRFTLNDV